MGQSILNVHHQIILIYKPDYVSFLLKYTADKWESKHLSISHLTHFYFSFSYICEIKTSSYSFLYLHFYRYDFAPRNTSLLFLPCEILFFRNQIRYHFLSEAIHDFPRRVGHHSTIIPKSSVNTHDYGTYDIKCKDLLA